MKSNWGSHDSVFSRRPELTYALERDRIHTCQQPGYGGSLQLHTPGVAEGTQDLKSMTYRPKKLVTPLRKVVVSSFLSFLQEFRSTFLFLLSPWHCISASMEQIAKGAGWYGS